MPDRARITSLEAIEAFRAKLILYRDKAGRILDETNDDVMRVRLWLAQERVAHWQRQVRRVSRELEQREQELISARLSGLREASSGQQAAVRKARQALRDAEEKRRIVGRWNRQFDHRVEPLARQVEKVRHAVGHDLGLAVAWLTEAIQTISAYAESSPPSAPAPSSSPGSANSAAGPDSDAGGAPP
jgi:hypothetical protein